MNKYQLLEKRAFQFAKSVVIWSSGQDKTLEKVIYLKQVIRSSSSIGANYIEANESLGLKDRMFRMKICRKEAKETLYWLRLLAELNSENGKDEILNSLILEVNELRKIFSAIIIRLEKNSVHN